MNLLILSILISISSIPPSQVDADFVIWGIFCGECDGDCATFYKLTSDGEIYVDKSERYFRVHDEPYSFHGKKKSNKKWVDYKWLLTDIPTQLFEYPDGEIGEPDHIDQCGFYLQIKNGGEINYWQIDPLKVPIEIKDFTDKLYKN